MMHFAKFFALFISLLVLTQSQGVSGCGGSIRASPAIMKVLGNVPNFSDITVSLLTVDGVIQEQTVCSPQGYFFIPMYDIGEYSLTVSKKDGWSVNPESVQVSLNEEGNVLGCENKIEFEVTGFRVHGHTHSLRSDKPTSGIEITLTTMDGHTIQTVYTDEEGYYTFENVVSGDYVVKASHPSWVLAEPSSQTISIRFGGMEVATDFLVSGYKLTGSIENDSGNHAITGVSMRLVNENGDLFECNNQNKKECVVEVDSKGAFTFINIQDGVYRMTPMLTSSIEWNIEPADMRVHIQSNSVDLGAVFVITGFNLHGCVYDENHKPMKDVCIGVDSHVTESCTNEKGEYVLYDLRERLYMIDAHHKAYHFSFIKLESKPGVQIQDLEITQYIQCGSLETALLKNYPSFNTRFTVQAMKNGEVVKEYQTFEQFCFILNPGVYDFMVKPVEATANIPALTFTDVKGVKLVNQHQYDDLVLSPIAQTIGGSVKMFNADAITVDLFYGSVKLGSTLTDKNHEFMFKGILPGVYSVRISDAKGCWGAFEDASVYAGSVAEIDVDVREHSVMNAELVQTGYVITIESPVEATADLISGGVMKTVELKKGATRFCMANKQYRMIPHACFECSQKEWIMSAEHTSVQIVPSSYSVEGTIEVAGSAHNIVVTALQNNEIVKETTAILKENHYVYSFMLPEGSYTLSYLAPSSSLLFYPRSQTISVIAGQCQSPLPVIHTREGRVVSGQIVPPLQGVTIRMSVNENGVQSVLETTSDEKGWYAFTAIDHAAQFISFFAIKEGHVFHSSPDGLNFSHQKLSSLRVHVVDEKNNNVEGVLLSLSSSGYNDNQMTREDGTFVFGQLFPGDYFLQYQLKEYAFSPSTSTVSVEEGVALEMTVACTRTAFSAFGSVTTITGQPIPKQRVLAISASGHREGGVTDAEGHYRIRGLRPGQEYTLSVQGVSNNVPANHVIMMSEEDQFQKDFLLLNTPTSATLYGVIESKGVTAEDLVVTAKGQKGKKTAKVTLGGSFEISSLNDEKYELSVSSSKRHQKLQCEEKSVVVDKTKLNEVSLKCTVEIVNEVEVAKGGSFGLLALVVIALFIFIEKDRLRQVF